MLVISSVAPINDSKSPIFGQALKKLVTAFPERSSLRMLASTIPMGESRLAQ